MRRTEDNHFVSPWEMVYEIMWQWINPELSEPYPEERKVREIPESTRIWKEKRSCQKECDRLLLKK